MLLLHNNFLGKPLKPPKVAELQAKIEGLEWNKGGVWSLE